MRVSENETMRRAGARYERKMWMEEVKKLGKASPDFYSFSAMLLHNVMLQLTNTESGLEPEVVDAP